MSFYFAKWFWSSIPRSPRRAGLLMRLYFLWQENFTAAGHAAAALMLLAIFVGTVPGFWAAWIFCAIDFLFFLTLVPSLFLTVTRNKFETERLSIRPVTEGCETFATAYICPEKKVDSVALGCFRADSSVRMLELDFVEAPAHEETLLKCRLVPMRRGAFKIPKVAVVIPEIKGMLRHTKKAGDLELLVYPRVTKILSMNFLTMGASGSAFAPLLMPNLSRGMNFVGIREYREGDSLRDLHHKAFARYGKPFTKEYEGERGSGCVLVLDVTARNLLEKSMQEHLVRLAAGVGAWFMEREILGRFFIGDEEIPLRGLQSMDSFLEALARIPIAKIGRGKKWHAWSPAARPMGPVLRLGLFAAKDSLVHKQIVVVRNGLETTKDGDDTLYVDLMRCSKAEVSL